jgi:hypothetical protein
MQENRIVFDVIYRTSAYAAIHANMLEALQLAIMNICAEFTIDGHSLMDHSEPGIWKSGVYVMKFAHIRVT